MDRNPLRERFECFCAGWHKYLIINSGAPLIHHDYIPLSRIYFYDLAAEDDMPIFLVSYNDLKIPIDASDYKEGTPSRIGNEDVTLHFVFNFITNLKMLEQKCT